MPGDFPPPVILSASQVTVGGQAGLIEISEYAGRGLLEWRQLEPPDSHRLAVGPAESPKPATIKTGAPLCGEWPPVRYARARSQRVW